MKEVNIKHRKDGNVVYAKDRENGGIQYIIGDVKTKNSARKIPLNDRAILAIQRLESL